MAGTATGRRQRLGAEERREQIMAATVVVLAAHGYQATTADAISREAGVSKGLLWHYFDNLDDLMHRTAQRTVAVLRETVAARIDVTAPLPELLRAAVHAAARLRHTHNQERIAVEEVIMNLRSADGSQRMTYGDYDETYTAQERLFRRGQEDGDVRTDLDPRLLAVTYQGAVDAMLGYLDAHPDADADRHADLVADVLLGGMQVPARTAPGSQRRGASHAPRAAAATAKSSKARGGRRSTA